MKFSNTNVLTLTDGVYCHELDDEEQKTFSKSAQVNNSSELFKVDSVKVALVNTKCVRTEQKFTERTELDS